MPAFLHISRKATARGLRLPSGSPNTMRMTVPVWRIRPGSAMVALMLATPGITARAPRIGISRSWASTPFWRVMTAVSGPTIGLIAAPGALDVPQLHAEQHIVDRTDLGRILRGLRRLQVRIAARTVDPQPVLLHGGEMGAARDEGDVGAGMRQRRPISASDAAGADNRDPHRTRLLS